MLLLNETEVGCFLYLGLVLVTKHGYLISGERIAYMCFGKIEINI